MGCRSSWRSFSAFFLLYFLLLARAAYAAPEFYRVIYEPFTGTRRTAPIVSTA